MKTDDYCWNIADFRKAISLWLNFVFWWICRILLISQCWTIIWRHSWQNCILDSYSGWIFANPHQTSWLDCWLLSEDHSSVILEANCKLQIAKFQIWRLLADSRNCKLMNALCRLLNKNLWFKQTIYCRVLNIDDCRTTPQITANCNLLLLLVITDSWQLSLMLT